MQQKKVNLEVIALAIKVGMLKIHTDLEEEFEKWPEDQNGTLVTIEQVRMGLVKLEKYGMDLIENITGKLPEVEIPVEEEDPVEEDPKEELLNMNFHHTQTDGPDGGQSLVMCPGENRIFDKCVCNRVVLPYHGKDDGRLSYWNQFDSGGSGKIICKLGEDFYEFPAVKGKILKGSCK